MCEELALFLIFQIPSLISVGRIRVERIGELQRKVKLKKNANHFSGRATTMFLTVILTIKI